MRGVRVVRDIEAVRCGASRLHVRVRDSDQVRDLGVHPGVVLAHRADPDDSDAHRRRHAPAKEASGYKRVAGAALVETFISVRVFGRMSGATIGVDPGCGEPVNPHHTERSIWYKGPPLY